MSESTSSRRTQPLSPAEVRAALAQIAQLKADVALCGGIALQLYGSQRFTFDIDLIASEPLASWPHGEPLSFGGYSTAVGNVPVDVLIRSDRWRDFYAAALLGARRMKGVPIPVVTAEYLAVLKLLAARRKDELDLEELLLSGRADIEACAAIAGRYLGGYAEEDLRRAYEDALVRQERDRRVAASRAPPPKPSPDRGPSL